MKKDLVKALISLHIIDFTPERNLTFVMFADKSLFDVTISFHINEFIQEKILPTVIYVEKNLLRLAHLIRRNEKFILGGGLTFIIHDDN